MYYRDVICCTENFFCLNLPDIKVLVTLFAVSEQSKLIL
jgi:hypothetical protein